MNESGKGRRRGRPKLAPGQETSQVTIQLPSTLHDGLSKRALELDIPVNELARRAIERELQPRAPNIQPEKSGIVRPGRY